MLHHPRIQRKYLSGMVCSISLYNWLTTLCICINLAQQGVALKNAIAGTAAQKTVMFNILLVLFLRDVKA